MGDKHTIKLASARHTTIWPSAILSFSDTRSSFWSGGPFLWLIKNPIDRNYKLYTMEGLLRSSSKYTARMNKWNEDSRPIKTGKQGGYRLSGLGPPSADTAQEFHETCYSVTLHLMNKASKWCCDTSTPESIHTKDESKRGTAFAFIFGVNWPGQLM